MKLIDYLPQVLKEIYEFKVLCDAGDKELIKLKENIDGIFREMFVYTAEGEGLARLEKVLNLTVSANDSPDFRRFQILAKLKGGNRNLMKRIEVLIGEDFTVDYYWSEYRLVVKLPLKNKKYLDAVKDMLDSTVPLNLIIEAVLKYNTYGMIKDKKLTYRDLKGKTFKQLREEELDAL